MQKADGADHADPLPSKPEVSAASTVAPESLRLTEELHALFNMAPEPVWLCDATATVLLANMAATLFVQGNSGVYVQDRILSAQVAHSGRTLSMREIIRLSQAFPEGLSCPLARTPGRAFIHIVPLALPTVTGEQRFIVSMLDGRAPNLSLPRLQMLFSLTEAEARLVNFLVSDLSIGEIARKTGLTRHTLRSQLKSVFRKVDVRRQTELVRVVLTLTRITNLHPRS